MQDSKQVLTIHEAAQILGVSTKTMRRWEKRGLLTPSRTPGNQRRYLRSDIEHFNPKQATKVLPAPPLHTHQDVSKDIEISYQPSLFSLAGTMVFIGIIFGIVYSYCLPQQSPLTAPQPHQQVLSATEQTPPPPTKAQDHLISGYEVFPKGQSEFRVNSREDLRADSTIHIRFEAKAAPSHFSFEPGNTPSSFIVKVENPMPQDAPFLWWVIEKKIP